MSDGEFQIAEPHMQIAYGKSKVNIMTGVEKIAQERLEQKLKHGHTIKNDWEQYPDFELASLAEALLEESREKVPAKWNTKEVERMMGKSYEERLVIVGALIAAEIDRLNFRE